MEYIKAIQNEDGSWHLEVLGVPYGSEQDRDSDNQFFNADTNTHEGKLPTIPAVYYHGRNEKGKPSDAPEYIGTAKHLRTDEKGVWYEVVLDKLNAYASRVWEAAKQGIARASSGSAPHLVRLGNNGHIREWPVFELSVFDTGEGRQPSNRHAVAMPMMKAIYEQAGIEMVEIQPEAASTDAADNESQKSKMENKEMETKDVQDLIDAALKADREAQAQALEAAKSRKAEIDAEVAKQVEAVKAEAAKTRRLPDYDGVAPYATKFNDSKYNNYSAADLALSADVLRSKGIKASDQLTKSMLLKVISENANSAEREEDLNYIKSAIPSHLQDEKALKAAEVMATGDSGNGAEWVATLYSPEIWRSIRHEGGIVSKIPSGIIGDGYNNEYVPLEDADPTWYTVPETTANDSTMLFPVASVPASKAGTGQKNIALTKKGARTVYSGELIEDSIVPFASQLREQLGLSGRELMEAWVINADSEAGASANVNDIGGTPAATDWFLGGNGFRKLALVTNTANSRSAGGALAIEDYLETMRLMGTAGIAAADMSKLSFIVDPNVHFANMSLPEVKTRDVFSAATIENGFLKYVYGVQILPSWQYHKGATGLKANTAGKVDLDTQGNNTTGAFLCVRWDQWKMKYKRRMTIELTRFANSDSYEIVALTRFGMGYRDSEASATTYNVGI